MLREYERDFMKILHQQLKEKIKAGIDVKIYDDVIKVKLYRNHELDFEYEIRDFSNKFLHGYSTRQAVDEIIRTYKKYIVATHFY